MPGIWKVPSVLMIAAVACFFLSLRRGAGGELDHVSYGTQYDLLYAPTSLQWRRPIGDFPQAAFTVGPLRTTRPTVHGQLPVVSLVLPFKDLFDPGTGIHTVGNAILHDADQVALKYMREPRWWKYPGNYLFRGKEWEREANMEVFDASGATVCNEAVGVRINGNTTRGFPQKALRVTFRENNAMPLFGDAPRTYSGIVLRASGNDQGRTMFRDALQHRLCEGLPFDVSRAVQSVVYINGVYWGIHNMRERVEDDELAKRHGLKKKDIVILADRALLYRGDDSTEVQRFKVMLRRLEKMDASTPVFVDSLEAKVDVDGFLTYLAAQIIFGNTDWPDQNVKYWRCTGARDTSNTKTDGRWRFIMGDSDLGFGYAEGPPSLYPDMFEHLQRKQGPVARLFRCCMRSPELEARFGSILHDLVSAALSPDRMETMVRAMAANIDEEMHRHVRRWRRPADHVAWQAHVQAMLTFAHNAPQRVLQQWEARKQR